MFEECRKTGDFVLSSGRKSNVFYDFDMLMPSETVAYVDSLLKKIPKEIIPSIDFIATPALGGIIPAFLVAFSLGKPLAILDKEEELRGPGEYVGNYLIVDDVTTSFKNANKVVAALPDASCLGVLSYIFRGSKNDLEKQDYPVIYLEWKEEEI